MHTCISSHGLKRSWRSCPRRVNAGNKNTPSTHHPRRRNVTTLMVGLKNGHIRKNLSGEPQRYSWGTKKKKKKNSKRLHSMGCKMYCLFKMSKSNASNKWFESIKWAQLSSFLPALKYTSIFPARSTDRRVARWVAITLDSVSNHLCSKESQPTTMPNLPCH